ncbi:Polynucleotide 5'-hydroxyl-kinase grc3 [Paraconiothyrium brasiliense]|uniref:Polynucleotide 5'-hydroxyl-kinase GRC3 n=1 Tax=Paraconiothyrium brasiliense TaxID=300254 RepID=A0ABR3RCD9_9PLEO
MSAIAAARLKAQKETAPIPAKHGLQEPPPSPLADSTKSEDAKSEPEDISLIPQNFKLSTWRKTKANVLSDTPQKLTIVLDKHSTASFVGHFDVKILKGAVNINGANLGATSIGSKEREKEYRVFACSTNPIMKIRGLDRTNHVQLRSCPEPTPLADMNPLFANLWGGNAENDKGRSFTGVTESDDDPLKRALVPELTPEDWLRTIDDISATASATFLVGSSICGKSTFAKRLLNRYVTGFGKTTKPFPAVCYLDLDPSSPEYTTHGQISLTIVRELNLGPGFTHPAAVNHINGNETIAAHAIPHHDLTNYEAYFSTCAEHLFQTYQNLRLDDPLTKIPP